MALEYRQLTLCTGRLRNLQSGDGHAAGSLEKHILALPTVLAHGTHSIDRHPGRNPGHRQGRSLVIVQIRRGRDEGMFGEDAVGSQDAVQRQPHAPRELLLGNLAGNVVREERREDAIAGFPFARAVADLGDHAAHVGAGDDGGLLVDGLVVGVEAHSDCTISISLAAGLLDTHTLRVTVVQRNRVDLDQDLAVARRGHGAVGEGEGGEAFAGGDELLDRHDDGL